MHQSYCRGEDGTNNSSEPEAYPGTGGEHQTGIIPGFEKPQRQLGA
jgi:hypothetical protein